MAQPLSHVSSQRRVKAPARLFRILGFRPALEILLGSLFVVVLGYSYFVIEAADGFTQRLLAVAGTTLFLTFCYVIKIRSRIRSTDASNAVRNGEIKQDDDLYRAVVDTAADAIVLADQRGVVLTFNPSAERIFGYTEAEALGQQVSMFIPQDQWAVHQASLTRDIDDNVPHIVGIGRVVDGIRKDGGVVKLHLSMAEWRNGGEEIGVTAILRDITEQLKSQQALIESERRIRQIVDCATDYAIYQLDLDDRMVKWNIGTEKMLGYSADELDGLSFRQFFPDEVSGESEAERTALAPVDLEGHETDGWMLRRDGSRFWASGVVRPIIDRDGRVIGKAVILRDVTAQRAGAETLQLAKDHAEAAVRVAFELRGEIEAKNLDLTAANQGLQQFTSIVAHDLRAPLKRIDAFIGALREDYGDKLDDEGQEIMTRVSRGAARMEMMLDSLLDYSRYNAKAITGKSADLAQVMKGVLETFDLNETKSKIRIDVVDVPRIKGDPLLLAHVFQNLISNSIKFRREDDIVIKVDAKRSGDIVIIRVTDNGIGIEPQFADQVFDMFQRLHDDDEYEGTGIGLTVCRKIISDHGGRIWIDKGFRGPGTRINITLMPAASEQEIDPLLAMLPYQSKRATRTSQMEADASSPDDMLRRTGARGHHAKFNRAAG